VSSGLSGAFLGTPRRLGRERLTRRDRDSPVVAPTLCCSVQIPTRSSCLAVTMPSQLVPCICKHESPLPPTPLFDIVAARLASPEQTSRIARVNISTSGFSSGGAECRAGMVRQARARGPRTEGS
jgi:hypothetical protein